MITSYKSLAKHLPREIFAPNPYRLLMFIAHVALSGMAVAAIVLVPMLWPFKLMLSLLIGHCWGANGLFGHELMHGSIVRSRAVQNILGFFSFLPFLISPTFWRFWHNNLHHTNTQRLLLDPDAYPTQRIYKQSRYMQILFPFTPGSGFKRSYLYFFFYFSLNVQTTQFYFRFKTQLFEKLDQWQVTLEMIAGITMIAGFLFWTGPSNWLWVALIPFAIQNYLVFSYISTNHNLSPLTKENDSLENSLSVTNHPVLEFLHMNFGYHVEHHIFPTVNPVHAKTLHKLLKSEFPERYQFMPKWQAMKALYNTARIYKSSTVLVNPLTGSTFETLGKREKVQNIDSHVAPTESLQISLDSVSAVVAAVVSPVANP